MDELKLTNALENSMICRILFDKQNSSKNLESYAKREDRRYIVVNSRYYVFIDESENMENFQYEVSEKGDEVSFFVGTSQKETIKKEILLECSSHSFQWK